VKRLQSHPFADTAPIMSVDELNALQTDIAGQRLGGTDRPLRGQGPRRPQPLHDLHRCEHRAQVHHLQGHVRRGVAIRLQQGCHRNMTASQKACAAVGFGRSLCRRRQGPPAQRTAATGIEWGKNSRLDRRRRPLARSRPAVSRDRLFSP